jgi:O-antigen ligase
MNEHRGPLAFAPLLTEPQMLLILVLASNLLTRERLTELTLLTLASGVFAVSVLTMLGFCPENVIDFSEATGGRVVDHRVAALGDDPNFFGATVALCVVVAASSLIGMEFRMPGVRLVAAAAIPFMANSLLRTESRGGVLVLAVGLVTLGWAAKRAYRARVLVLLLVLAVAVGGYIFVTPSFRARVERSLYDSDTSNRTVLVTDAISLLKQKPVLGFGRIGSVWELGAIRGADRSGSHNVFVSALLSSGVVGGTCYFVGAALCLAAAVRSVRRPGGGLVLALVVMTLISGLMIDLDIKKSYWLVLAMPLAAVRRLEAHRRHFRLSRFRGVTGINDLRRLGAIDLGPEGGARL